MSTSAGGKVELLNGISGLPLIKLRTQWSEAEVYLHGAHVTGFQKHDEEPLLFLSKESRFAEGQAIRGGVPVIFPWFGPKEGKAQHGFARVTTWELKETATAPEGAVSARLELPKCPEMTSFQPCKVQFIVTVGAALAMELAVTNESPREMFAFENCLHSYFEISDISAISIKGLKGAEYQDKTDGFVRRTEERDKIKISSEVDRVYLNTTQAVEILDPGFGRKIVVEKEASLSTVVWNPWTEKARQMADFGDEEYKRMVCVESGNVGENQIQLPPGETSRLRVTISSTRV
ncbi:MAG: D-hexose-6-phosphate mutarotase [Verrucomicrobia bacterium]|nr:MAG: D-hexose-6-phosphate mutarotase [Verrucomicrobiota bacterium]